MSAAPFHLRYDLSRGQRLGPHLLPWAPCLGASLGYTLGIVFLAKVVSAWFLPALVLPAIYCRRFFALALGILVHPAEPVDLFADETHLELRAGGVSVRFALAGIVQVYRSEHNTWTVLNRDNTAVTIPAAVISEEQLRYLKSFVRRTVPR
jgi:hypothetical protein